MDQRDATAAAELIDRSATITCPQCGHLSRETMPLDRCVFFYECAGCGSIVKPLKGDCCVFCSYADRKCPPRGDRGCCAH